MDKIVDGNFGERDEEQGPQGHVMKMFSDPTYALFSWATASDTYLGGKFEKERVQALYDKVHEAIEGYTNAEVTVALFFVLVSAISTFMEDEEDIDKEQLELTAKRIARNYYDF